MVLEKTLRVPWTSRRSNQSILREISPEYSLEGLMLKLKLNTLATWCKELTHWKRPWCWERLRVGGEGDDRGRDGWMASLTQWMWVWVTSGSWWWTGRLGVLQSMGSQRVGHDWVTELNWKSSGWSEGPALVSLLERQLLVTCSSSTPMSQVTPELSWGSNDHNCCSVFSPSLCHSKCACSPLFKFPMHTCMHTRDTQ